METQEVLTFIFPNPEFHSSHHTDKFLLVEVVAFILGETLYNGPTENYLYNGDMLNYLEGFVGPLDKHAIQLILDEIQVRVKEISADHTFICLLNTDEIYLKYDYKIGRHFTKLNIYTDGGVTHFQHTSDVTEFGIVPF